MRAGVCCALCAYNTVLTSSVRAGPLLSTATPSASDVASRRRLCSSSSRPHPATKKKKKKPGNKNETSQIKVPKIYMVYIYIYMICVYRRLDVLKIGNNVTRFCRSACAPRWLYWLHKRPSRILGKHMQYRTVRRVYASFFFFWSRKA